MTSRAIDWYINESILGGSGGLKNWGGSPEFYWATFTKYKYIFGILSSSPVDWHPCRVIWLKGGSGCPVIGLHGMSQVGRGGVFRQITSNWFQICSLRIALHTTVRNFFFTPPETKIKLPKRNFQVQIGKVDTWGQLANSGLLAMFGCVCVCVCVHRDNLLLVQ